jgi:hypothetical protein
MYALHAWMNVILWWTARRVALQAIKSNAQCIIAMHVKLCAEERDDADVSSVIMQEQFGYTPAMMGLLQSSILLGYFVGQVRPLACLSLPCLSR